MARHDSGSVGHSRKASRALALASLHFFCSIIANAWRASRRDCQALIAPPIGGAAKYIAAAIVAIAGIASRSNRLMRRARTSSGGVRSRSSFATGRDGCLATPRRLLWRSSICNVGVALVCDENYCAFGERFALVFSNLWGVFSAKGAHSL